VNGYGRDEREPDPQRLTLAYFHSAATLNFIRSLVSYDCEIHLELQKEIESILKHHKLSILNKSEERPLQQQQQQQATILSSTTSPAPSSPTTSCSESYSDESLLSPSPPIPFDPPLGVFTSHEGLLLNYEEVMTRSVNRNGKTKQYNLGAHFLWIGDRTRQFEGAHVEYFRGIENPIGLKVGPTLHPNELSNLVRILNPRREAGRLTLITRYGFNRVRDCLPKHIQTVKDTQIPVVWCCDPCHGNTIATDGGLKTRDFNCILEELRVSFEIHKSNGTNLSGVHLELSGEEDITECTGGVSRCIDKDSLRVRYETVCDPRLNRSQSVDLSFLLADMIRLGARS